MTQQLLRTALASALLAAISAGAHAHLVNPVTIDFQGLSLGAIAGNANQPAQVGGACPAPGTCYEEDGVIFGIVDNPTPASEHIHRAGSAADRKLAYHADSTGIYIRAKDGHEFALLSLDFNAEITDENPDTGPNDVWEILGFNTAVNPDLARGNGTDYTTRVAYQTVANGQNLSGANALVLDEAFHLVDAVWIHYKGFPAVPGTAGLPAKDFGVVIDNVRIGPAVEPVPVPAAVWMLGSGVVALGALRRRARHPA